MNKDVDRLLKDSLRHVAEDFEPGHRQRRAEARARFITRHRRRSQLFPIVSIAGATAVIAAIAFVAYGVLDRPTESKRTNVAGRPSFELTIPIEGTPRDLGAREGIWVANPAEGRVERLDPGTGEIIASVEVGTEPSVISIGPGRIWVGDPSTGSIYKIDPRTNEVEGGPIQVGSPSSSMAVSVGTHAVWVVIGNELVTVKARSGRVERVEEADQAVDVAARLPTVWVLDAGEGLLRFDGETGARIGEPISIEGVTGDVFAAHDTIWIGNTQGDSIVRVDERGRLLDITQLDGSYIDLAVGPNALWVLSQQGDNARLTALDLSSGEPLASPLELNGGAVNVTTGGGGIWVSQPEREAVIRIDAQAFLD